MGGTRSAVKERRRRESPSAQPRPPAGGQLGRQVVTKSISSSTRPSSAGSRSAYERDPRQDVLPRPGDVGLVAVRPAELLADAVLPRHRRAGTVGHAAIADPIGLDRLPDVDVRMPDDQHVLADRASATDCGDPCSPSSQAPGGRRARRPGGPGLARTSRRWSGRSSTPSRYSTTTPSMRRSSPHTFSTSSASWRPSTKIRLARATRACACGDGDRSRTPSASAAAARRGRGDEDDWLALEQETRARAERSGAAAPVLELDACRGRGRPGRSRRTSRCVTSSTTSPRSA